MNKGQLDAAIAACRRAIALKPNSPKASVNLGNALAAKGQFDEAMAAYRHVLAIRPDYAEAHCNLANVLREKGELDEALAACRQAIALNPNLPETYVNLGNVLIDKGQLDEAIATYRQAMAIKPDYAEAHHNLGLSLLMRCEFEQGWLEYEWRWKSRSFSSPRRGFSQPRWDGGDLKGRTILLYAEQGIGDTIQFIRYLPMVVERGGKIFVETQKELIRLLRQLPGVERWIARGDALPAFDVHCPLMSLPRLFNTTLQTIPSQKDILLPDPALAQAWRLRLEQQPPGFKVGLVWAGRPTHKNDRNRSISLSLLAPLATVEGISFYSLQKGEAARQTADPPAGMRIIDWTDELHDFADTAALIAQLDLIISVDTAVVHLAASMGKPVWMLIPFVPDWRWTLNRDDSPWYPTIRLFRQTAFGDWPGVIGRVVEAARACLVLERVRTMRIIAGEFRGRRLLGPEGQETRPITDRVKQSLFDILQPTLEQAVVYDLFAGTGSMGLECLSRASGQVTFFDADRSALGLLRKNITALGVESRCRVVAGDLFGWFERSGRSQGQAAQVADLIFLDPPYRFLRERAAEMRQLAVNLAGCLRPEGVVMFRHDAGESLELPPLKKREVREYGSMVVEFLGVEDVAGPTEAEGGGREG